MFRERSEEYTGAVLSLTGVMTRLTLRVSQPGQPVKSTTDRSVGSSRGMTCLVISNYMVHLRQRCAVVV